MTLATFKYDSLKPMVFFISMVIILVINQGHAKHSSIPQFGEEPGLGSGGIVAGDETVCTNELPSTIENITSPEGALYAFLSIKWEQKTEDSEWTVIPGEMFLEYTPISVTETTQYRRCSRQHSDMPWNYSNVVTKHFRNGIEAVTLTLSHVTCKRGENGEITATVTGGTPDYIFDWSNGASGDTLDNLTAGEYYVLVQDLYGCSYKTENVVIHEPLLEVKVEQSLHFEPACPEGTNGAIFVEGYDGVTPFSYLWSNGNTEAANTNLPEGEYTVQAIDANGCESLPETFYITAPDTFTISKTTQVVSCAGEFDGEAYLELSGGTPPYTYNWPDGENNPNRSGLATGTYLVGITDAHGCYHGEDVFIFEPEALQVEPFIVNNKICLASVNLAPYGGTAPYSFEWSDETTNRFNNDLCPGEYTVKVTDIKGCEAVDTIVINADYTKQEINIEVAINTDYTAGIVSIDLPNDENANIRVYATNGKLVQTFDNMKPTSEKRITLTLDLSDMTSGLYLVEVSTGELSSSTKIVIPN